METRRQSTLRVHGSTCPLPVVVKYSPSRMLRSLARRLCTSSTSSLAGKVALVTGAGTGIGRETSLALAGEGASLVLAGRRAEPLAETAELILKAGGAKPLCVPTDLTSPEAIGKLFAALEEEHGRLDILFNNAGTGAPAVPIDELPLEKWTMSVDTNLTAAFICTQHAFRIMKKQSPMGGGSSIMEACRPIGRAPTQRHTHGDEACDHRTHKELRIGRTALQDCMRTDRHREC